MILHSVNLNLNIFLLILFSPFSEELLKLGITDGVRGEIHCLRFL